ncbi:hypothetical protein GQ55_9G035300 [Panicum hallii var. hallii]|uniref:Uncharacterized protein n=1 Tax=Panicum hallii var. hallii TaxID=1504633 RepID=A0A2T7BZA5_9POAL|nr:hypothetical protein GQ55_9G035300 [Panicum hallii var. hallii]
MRWTTARGKRPLPRVRRLDVPFPVSGGSAPPSSLLSSFSHDQCCRSLFSFTSHTRAPMGFLRLPPRRPSDALEREEAKAAGRARSRAAPPQPPSAASPAPLRRRAARLLPASLDGRVAPPLACPPPMPWIREGRVPPLAPQVAVLSSPLLHELEVGGSFFLTAGGLLRQGVGSLLWRGVGGFLR